MIWMKQKKDWNMSKLTKNIREAMARKLVAFRYVEEAKQLAYLNRTLAERAYTHCYPPELLAHMEVVEKAYPKSFYRREGLRVNAGGYQVEVGDKLRSRWVKFEEVVIEPRMTAGEGYYSTHHVTDGKLVEEIKAFATRYKNFNDTCSTAYSEALSVPETMTTGKKLAEAWPEAIPVIGDLIPEGSRTLPVVQVSAVNAKFGLPPKTPVKETV
jgi:hypothetical protein